MAITASLVKELRERTGSGMMECKKALVETDGDIDAAIELMRKSGKAKAAKKSIVKPISWPRTIISPPLPTRWRSGC